MHCLAPLGAKMHDGLPPKRHQGESFPAQGPRQWEMSGVCGNNANEQYKVKGG